jgi:hypothetical protein
MKKVIIGILKGYKKSLGLVLPNSCRFYPSCSSYAIQAFERFGLLRASLLTIRRLSRCHPFHPGGVDLPPPSGKKTTRE